MWSTRRCFSILPLLGETQRKEEAAARLGRIESERAVERGLRVRRDDAAGRCRDRFAETGFPGR